MKESKGYFCPFRIYGDGTKCNQGRPFRDYIKESNECMAWLEGRCALIFKEVEY